MLGQTINGNTELASWGERVGEEARKSFSRYVEGGFIDKYLSGQNVLDIGYRGYVDAVPIVPHAIGVELDYPGYDGITLPFPEFSQDAVFSSHTLEHIVDYRSSLRDWFRVLKVGGHLIVAVPHQYLYERKLTMPSDFNGDHKRFYTPGILLLQVEEALDPFSYRVRVLEDNDRGFDYAILPDEHADGCYEIFLVIEKIQRPGWADAAMQLEPKAHSPQWFHPQVPKDTVVEHIAGIIPHPENIRSILVNKLDHRGDFIIAEKAFRALRASFPDSAITLACGPWNVGAAKDLGIFDHIVPTEFFPEDVRHDSGVYDLNQRAEKFAAAFKGKTFDLAIDLRIDADTRLLLTKVDAHYRAGFGNKLAFPFLDFSLPYTNPTYSCRAERLQITAGAFANRTGIHEGFRIRIGKSTGRPRHELKRHIKKILKRFIQPEAFVVGPYRSLETGNYVIKPLIEIDTSYKGLSFDIATDYGRTILGGGDIILGPDGAMPYHLCVDEPIENFEFRIYGSPGDRFDFFGLSLIKQGEHDSFHQEEALVLLSVMAALRLENPKDVITVKAGE